MPPVSSGSSSKQKQLSKAPTFQINGYERGRLKSFPPHTIPKPRVIRFDARNVRHDSLNCLCRQCLTDKKTPVSRTSSGEADVTIGDPNIKLPEILPIIKSSIRNEVDSSKPSPRWHEKFSYGHRGIVMVAYFIQQQMHRTYLAVGDASITRAFPSRPQ